MHELVQWLHAQLDEDERIATGALHFVDAHWRVDVARNVVLAARLTPSGRQSTAVTADDWRYPKIGTPGLVPHVAEHDPARVLQEIDAKRQLLTAYTKVAASDINDWEYANGYANALAIAVRLAALPYAHRPGYQASWRPEAGPTT
ncbi:DUF6221 family protein [Streptomyces antibioticus]|uniref:DUF6221 family protein n=1 Tax=Streptomyces antibioticus TaxID=1890 RepID=UPI0036879024